jgi:hypothetical protein
LPHIILPAISAAAAREIDALVIPVGVTWEKVTQTNPEFALYDRDKSHPSAEGTCLAACVFYAKLFEHSPVGLPSEGISAADAAALQQAAWAVCSNIRS